MKVILTKDVAQLGDAGTLHEVKPGFARNYLIPKGLAQAATAGTIKQVQLRQAAEQRRIAKQEAEQQDLAGRIEGLRLEEKDAGPEPLELEYTIGAFEERPAFAALRFALRDADGQPTAICGVAASVAEASFRKLLRARKPKF